MEFDGDVIVVGAGLAGASTAALLSRAGRRVVLIDPRPACLPIFQAEKLGTDQAAALRRLGLMEGIRSEAAPIASVTEGHQGRILRVMPTEEYGIFYQNLVNAVRRQVPNSVDFRLGRVNRVTAGRDTQVVHLDTGQQVTGRLVVLTTGTQGRLHESIGVVRRIVRASHSVCSGFDVERNDGAPFPFQSLTYWADSLDDAIDYVTFFPIPGRMRVNLFSYRAPIDPWLRMLAADPWQVLMRAMPRLQRITGTWRATSPVQSRPISLYVAESVVRDGVVVLGDAFQSVCPSTGTGVLKVLTDVERLCTSHIASWLSTPGMSTEKIASFYDDESKVLCDRYSLDNAEYRRDFGTNRTLWWGIHRRKQYAHIALSGLWT